MGCGKFKKKGFINVDYIKDLNPDVLHNLDTIPYPFDDDEFDLIEANHLLEHLFDPFLVMNELYRILRKNGKLIIRVPHYSRGFSHPEHKRGFDVSFPLYFNSNFLGGYMGFSFDCTKIKLTWFSQRYLKKSVLSKPAYFTGILLGFFIDIFANLSPYLCSRLWCFWVGGFEEIKFVFIKK